MTTTLDATPEEVTAYLKKAWTNKDELEYLTGIIDRIPFAKQKATLLGYIQGLQKRKDMGVIQRNGCIAVARNMYKALFD